ncbi:MAG: DUF5693 family protein, partial [Actinomycetota bacterium]
MFHRFHRLPILLLLIGVIAALLSLAQRYQVEARSRRVALVVDYTQLRSLASATGVSLEDALHKLKGAGITGVAVTEDTLGDLQIEGALQVQMSGADAEREYRVT